MQRGAQTEAIEQPNKNPLVIRSSRGSHLVPILCPFVPHLGMGGKL